MALDPHVAALLEMLSQMPIPDLATATADEMRAAADNPMQLGEPLAMARVEEIEIPLEGRTLAARLYVPADAGDAPPLTLYYHGGGWVIGTLDTHDSSCRALAAASGSAVLSVAYRLAPECRYPGPVEDCYGALCWAAGQGEALGVDATRLAVAGDSAGGNLSAAMAILARDRGGPPLRFQLLIYPVTDDDLTRKSYLDHGGGDKFLSTEIMRWFWKQYLGDTPSSEAPLAVMLRNTDLSGLAPAAVLAAECDPLCDEGMAYAARLEAAGVPTEAVAAPGMIHGFVSMAGAIPAAQQWIDWAGNALRRGLA